MTACVNRKHTKKVAAVVTASLVGALSLGAAPVAAMAEDTGIDLQAADWTTGAKVTRATDGKGATLSGSLEQQTFTIGSGKFLVPTELTGDFETTKVTNDMLVYYGRDKATEIGDFNDAKTFFDTNSASKAGTYYVAVEIDGVESAKFPFKLAVEGKVEGVKVKGSLVYNGNVQTPSFVDGEGNDITPDSGTLSYTNGLGHTATPKSAGDYVANFKYKGQSYSVPFSIAKLNLSEASLVFEDMELPVLPTDWDDRSDFLNHLSVNGSTQGAYASLLDVSKVVNPSGGATLAGGTGNYQITVIGNSSDKNVTGSATVSFTILDNDVAQKVYYGRYDVSGFTGTGAYPIYLEDGDAFDASKIVVTDGASNPTEYSGDQLEISYYDTINKKTVDASALANPGTYQVTVRVVPFQEFASDDYVGGTIQFNVAIVGTKITADEGVAFYLDGELSGNAGKVTYDGTDQLEKLTAVIKDSEGNEMVEGTDYTLEIKDKATGKVVDSAVNAGDYTIEVKPLTFELDSATDATFTLTVDKVQLNWIVASTGSMLYPADEETGQIPTSDPDGAATDWNKFYLAYTGSAIEMPGLTYEVKSGTSYSYPELSADLYNVVSITKDGKVVDEIKDKGDYIVDIALTDEAAVNYQLNDDNFIVTVREFGHFADVQPDAWYAVPVEKAYDELYVNGISGTNLFAPEADITRADAVCILFNMAGGDSAYGDDEFQYNEMYGYNTGFNDVDGHSYFAKALAWAHASGVANGSNGDFRPYDKITREEFASLLANYAKNKGDFTAAADDALDGMSDANTVSDWAEDNVAWAVENGVMGNGGFVAGQSNISRAEVAAMAVNYQPENLTGLTRADVEK